MEIVLDTSAIIAFIANEPERASIVSLTKGATLIAPASVHWEVGNAFSAMFKRQRLNLDNAIKALTVYRTIPIRFVEVELLQSLQLAAGEKIYSYDAYLLQCSLKYRAALLTLDANLAAIARKLGVRVLEASR